MWEGILGWTLIIKDSATPWPPPLKRGRRDARMEGVGGTFLSGWEGRNYLLMYDVPTVDSCNN
jgi:hypothetical protein